MQKLTLTGLEHEFVFSSLFDLSGSFSLFIIPVLHSEYLNILSKHKTASPLWFYFRPLERRKLRIHFYDSRVTDDHYHMFTWEIWRLWILNRILDAKWTLECARAKSRHSGIPLKLTNLLVTNYTQSNDSQNNKNLDCPRPQRG